MTDSGRWLSKIGRRMGRKKAGDQTRAPGPESKAQSPAPLNLQKEASRGWHVMLELSMPDARSPQENALPCFMTNISGAGLAIACGQRIPVGTPVRLKVRTPGKQRKSVQCEVQIMEHRIYSRHVPAPDGFDVSSLVVHDCALRPENAILLMRAALACIAYRAGLEGAKPVSWNTGAEPDVSPAGQWAPTEIEYGELPLILVDEVNEEIRRTVERRPYHMPLAYMDSEGRYHHVLLHAGKPDHGIATAPLANLRNISADGARIETELRFEPGDQVALLGISVHTGSVLFEDLYTVMNKKVISFDDDPDLDAYLGVKRDAYAYGLKAADQCSGLLRKSIADSQQLFQSRPGEQEA